MGNSQHLKKFGPDFSGCQPVAIIGEGFQERCESFRLEPNGFGCFHQVFLQLGNPFFIPESSPCQKIFLCLFFPWKDHGRYESGIQNARGKILMKHGQHVVSHGLKGRKLPAFRHEENVFENAVSPDSVKGLFGSKGLATDGIHGVQAHEKFGPCEEDHENGKNNRPQGAFCPKTGQFSHPISKRQGPFSGRRHFGENQRKNRMNKQK